MALTSAPICDFGWKAVDFLLRGVDGKTYSLTNVRGPKGTLIVFICNHCPYVRAIADRLVEEIKALQTLGIGAVAIMSNDTVASPGDSFENMKRFAADHKFSFPYVIDETQDIARAYGAVCTPDFFGFNASDELQYRGRLDESKTTLVKGARRELYGAMKQVAETGRGPKAQIASMGCSIKWRDAAS
jgi:peroxiredoxin